MLSLIISQFDPQETLGRGDKQRISGLSGSYFLTSRTRNAWFFVAHALLQRPSNYRSTFAIELKRKRSKINEADLYPPAHNGVVAGSSPVEPTNVFRCRSRSHERPVKRRRTIVC
jgi:hypothetical protein